MPSHILTLRKIDPELRDQKPKAMDTFKNVYGADDDYTVDFGDVVHYSVDLSEEEVEEYINDDTAPSNLIAVEENATEYVQGFAGDELDPQTVNNVPTMETLGFHHTKTTLDGLQEDGDKIDKKPLVAIIDTGHDQQFPLKRFVRKGKSWVSGEPYDQTRNFHGMHCAGLAHRAGIGMEFLIAKTLSNSGSGNRDDCIAAIYWAIENGADVISMSLSGEGTESAAYKAAIDKATEHDINVWVAMGNDGQEKRMIPAAVPGALAVIALQGPQNIKADFSNYGSWAFTCADGYRMVSYGLGGKIQEASGTSMATPYCAGEDALLVAQFGRKSARKRAFINEGNHKLDIPDNQQGRIGKICVHKARQYMQKQG